MQIVLVAGTHGKNDPWCQPDSPFCARLRALGHDIPLEPFTWSTRLDGVIGKNDHWQSSGWELYHYARELGSVAIIAHSHGGQVAAHAISMGLKNVSRWVTVATPVRRDMDPIYRQAASRVGRWIHIHSDHSDWWQILGVYRLGMIVRSLINREPIEIQRAMPHAHENASVPGIGHTGALDADLLAQYLI